MRVVIQKLESLGYPMVKNS